MSANLEQAILEKIQALPDEKQQEVLALVDEMLKEDQAPRSREARPIWESITEISSQAPPETWDDVPSDGSVNHDHYLYGAPKRSLPFVSPTGNPITQEEIDDAIDAY